MSITKQSALKALAQEIRRRYNFEYDKSLLLSEEQVNDFITSTDRFYQRFGKICKGEEYKLGGHPDFDHLTQPDNIGHTEEGEITTFFLDLKNFTKYCCFLPREKVYEAKAATIAAVINICWLYGGHLHEIPGDGVLFFFGRKVQEPVETSIFGVQAACDAMVFLEEEIIPEYNDEDEYPSIYPKMGIDFGATLWGAYGSSPHYEVKATAFNVDIASKMMDFCKAREIAIGDSLKNFLKIDEKKYLKPAQNYEKSLTVKGEKKNISYKTWIFDWRAFRSDNMDANIDLAKLGIIGERPPVIKSKTTLKDAPLA